MKMLEKGSKKGISPIVATVLLVVVAIALFLLIFSWIRSFQKEVITKYGTPIETVCMNLRYDVTKNDDIVQINNLGSTTIYKAKIYVDGILKNTITTPIMPAESGQIQIDVDQIDVENCNKNIKVIPVLAGTTKTGAQREYACEKAAKTIPC